MRTPSPDVWLSSALPGASPRDTNSCPRVLLLFIFAGIEFVLVTSSDYWPCYVESPSRAGDIFGESISLLNSHLLLWFTCAAHPLGVGT